MLIPGKYFQQSSDVSDPKTVDMLFLLVDE